MQERLTNIVDNISDYFLELDERSAKFTAWKYVPSILFFSCAQYSAFFVGRKISSFYNLTSSMSNAVMISSMLIFTSVSCDVIYGWYKVLYYKKHKIDEVNKKNKLLWEKYGDAVSLMQHLYSELGDFADFVFLPIYHYSAKNDGHRQGSFIRAAALDNSVAREYEECKMSSSDPDKVRQYFKTAHEVLRSGPYKKLMNNILKNLHNKLNEGAMSNDRYFYNRLLFHRITTMDCSKRERINLLDWLDQQMSDLRIPLNIENVLQIDASILAKQLSLEELQYTKADWKKLCVGHAGLHVDISAAGLKMRGEYEIQYI